MSHSSTLQQQLRRLSDESRMVLEDQAGKLRSLGCRSRLDVADAVEIAWIAADKKDHDLSKRFLTRMSNLEDLCESSELSTIPWLLAKGFAGNFSLVEPQSAWHSEVQNLVGLVRPIAEGPKRILNLLKVKSEEDLDDHILMEQLLGIAGSPVPSSYWQLAGYCRSYQVFWVLGLD